MQNTKLERYSVWLPCVGSSYWRQKRNPAAAKKQHFPLFWGTFSCFSWECVRWYTHWTSKPLHRQNIITGNAISAINSNNAPSHWPVNQVCIPLGLPFMCASRIASVTHTLGSVVSATIVKWMLHLSCWCWFSVLQLFVDCLSQFVTEWDTDRQKKRERHTHTHTHTVSWERGYEGIGW